jgi:citrate synthase
LAGVAVTSTTVGDVLGDRGMYHYRGRSAVELARSGTFEEAASLVLDATGLPVSGDRGLPGPVGDAVASLDLRTALSLLGASVEGRPLIDVPLDERRVAAVRMISAFPTLVASVSHRRPTRPRDDLGHVANYLWMLTGRTEPTLVSALETYLILTIDHGFNSSTFAARVIASTGADLGGCLVGAYSALTGPRHGAAQSRVLVMLDDIGRPERAEEWMTETIAGGGRIMGFGHSVYRRSDPRAALLREVTAEIAPERHSVAVACEDAAERVLAGRRLATNVDLYACIVLEACGIPPSLHTATFAAARMVGWCAHVLEQANEPKVIRPAAYYVGDPPEM